MTTLRLAAILSAADATLLAESFDDPDADRPLLRALLRHPRLSAQDGALRAVYVGGEMGSERIVVRHPLPRPTREATLTFRVRFADGFDFARGGKLHGLGPSRPVTGGDPGRPDGWSVRLMWTRDGGLQTYVYHQGQPGKYGDVRRADDFAFEPGRWHEVSLAVRVNAPPDAANGLVRATVDGRVVAEHEGLRLRAAGGDDTLVRQFLFSTFHGGNGPEWAPRDAGGGFATVHAEFDDVEVEAGVEALDAR